MAPVREDDLDSAIGGTGDHMIIGHDIAVLGNNKAGAFLGDALLLLLAVLKHVPHPAASGATRCLDAFHVDHNDRRTIRSKTFCERIIEFAYQRPRNRRLRGLLLRP